MSARLAALHEYRLLDTPADDELSAVVRAAAAVARVAHATLNLIDEDRQCQLTTVGFEGGDSAREDSMCALHFEDGELVHVVDASLDPRFARNPWVDGRLGKVRFYASSPLISPAGHALGSLCVFDTVPGHLDEQQMDVLRDLATVLVALFERRRQTRLAEHQAQEAAEARELMAVVMAEAEERWELSEVIGETIDVGLVVVDPRGHLTSFNRTARRWHGLGPDASLDPGEHAGTYALFAANGTTPLPAQNVPVHRVLREGAVDGVEIVIAPRGRSRRMVVCSGRLMRRADGTPLGAVVAMTDVTADRAQAQALGAAHTELASAHSELAAHTARVEALAEASRALATAEEPHEVICQAVRDLTGADAVYLLQPDEQGNLGTSASVGLPVDSLHVPAGETSLPGLALAAGRSLFVADVPAHPAASARLVQTLGTASGIWQPVVLPGRRVVGVLGVYWRTPHQQLPSHVLPVLQTLSAEAAHAIERAELLARLAQAAERDSLTGLANRRRWDQVVDAEVQRAERSGAPLTLAMIDLDHFKRYNDTHGHLEGDALLREFADAASSCLRGIDTLARWGGEEFVLALPGCTGEDARVVVNRIRTLVPRGQTCTVGVAQWSPGLTAAQVIAQADEALYRGKEGGRDTTIVCSSLHLERTAPAAE
ncbi:diguanylate cyclase [Kineococcus sp. NBC_00420]|uniref:diguanylate cyclase domain-containing protein n=1 Tax=Kineococcus sp. NBC_00420 TaxID=2903564 RepID=UPI002E1B9B85